MVKFHFLLRGIILLGFSLLMFKLIVTGNITKFIAPKMLPFIYFCLVTFFVLAIIQLWRSQSSSNSEPTCDCEGHELPKTRGRAIFIYSLFIFPILSGFVFKDAVLDSSVVAKRGFKSEILAASSNKAVEVQDDENLAERYLEDPEAVLKELEEEAKKNTSTNEESESIQGIFAKHDEKVKKELLEQDVLKVTEDNFITATRIIDQYSDEFVGKKIEYSGFVYREADFSEDQFVIARFGISCCTADASVYGTIASYENAKKFSNDEWVKVTGTLSTTIYHDFQIPLIQVEKVEKIEQPEDPYVYEVYEVNVIK